MGRCGTVGCTYGSQSVVSSNPTRCPRWFLEHELIHLHPAGTYPSVISHKTKVNWGPFGRLTGMLCQISSIVKWSQHRNQIPNCMLVTWQFCKRRLEWRNLKQTYNTCTIIMFHILCTVNQRKHTLNIKHMDKLVYWI